MSRESFSGWGKHCNEPRVALGGASRVAQLFVPKSKSSPVIRLGASRQSSIARRQLARLIEPRRMPS
jgi:hypothetical protein